LTGTGFYYLNAKLLAQISRALERIYGASIPYREILDRDLVVAEDRAVAFKDPGRLLADHPELRPRGTIALVPFLLAVMIRLAAHVRRSRQGSYTTKSTISPKAWAWISFR
jgi:hypothetical protein